MNKETKDGFKGIAALVILYFFAVGMGEILSYLPDAVIILLSPLLIFVTIFVGIKVFEVVGMK